MGPLITSVTDTVGEAVGVVRDSGFALGITPLNDKTVGGWPKEFDAYGFGSEVLQRAAAGRRGHRPAQPDADGQRGVIVNTASRPEAAPVTSAADPVMFMDWLLGRERGVSGRARG
ncbi:hypothetical protein ACFY20_41920 [Streptomyces sp. NPDC001312]|uniref:hypothetical protein n=1 Tax=Streptomyces sp. NPDC001312 TaxID=3364561 RepID=UPI0036D12D8E